MAVNIDEIVSNCFYNDSWNIKYFDQSQIDDDDLIEAKQICTQMQGLLEKFKNIYLDYELNLNEFYELGMQFLGILKKRSLVNICPELMSQRFNKSRYMSQRAIYYRVIDLVADIEEFYRTYIPLIDKRLKCLDIWNFQNTSEFILKYAMIELFNDVELITLSMDDLFERIPVLMHPIDPFSTNMLMFRTRPHKRANLIARAAARVLHRCQTERSGQNEILEMGRLNRRMIVVLKEATFLKFSPRDERRYDIYERLSKYQDVLRDEDARAYSYLEIVRRVKQLKQDSKINCRQFLIANNRIAKFFLFRSKSQSKVVVNITNIVKMFKNISNTFESYAKRFELIRKLMDEAWNAEYQIDNL